MKSGIRVLTDPSEIRQHRSIADGSKKAVWKCIGVVYVGKVPIS